MSKLLIFNFDGTSNEANAAIKSMDDSGVIKDDNITNILKFHLLCGGNLKRQATSWQPSKQLSFYYHGVGTYGSKLRRLINSLISPEASDIATILNDATSDLKKYHQSKDMILLTGFSRGAALARRFATLIEKHLPTAVVYIAVFDTVASLGLPNLNKKHRPKSEIVFEYGCTLSTVVKKALHIVSLDDKRKAFQPTLMNQEKHITELWFAGAHSDVGGGYYQDGLSDITLRYMLDWLTELQQNTAFSILIKQPKDIQFDQLFAAPIAYRIDLKNIDICPDPLGFNHQQDRIAFVNWLTLTDRKCCVIKSDKITTLLPLIHESVEQRMTLDESYRPNSLKHIEYKVLQASSLIIS